MATSSNPVRIDAQTARDAVANGQRDEADSAARFNSIGGASGAQMVLLRNASPVGACALTMSRVGRDITVSQSGAWTGVQAATIGTGTWVARVQNAADPTRYIDLSIPSDVTVSTNLVSNGAGQITPFVIRTPSYDTGGVTAFPLATDARTVAYLDASKPWADQPAAVAGGYGGREIIPQINPSWTVSAAANPPVSGNRMYMLPESGVVSGGITVMSRIADPLDGTKRAILHRVHPSAETIAGSARSAYLTPSELAYNRTYWTAFACRWPAWPGQFTTVFDVHDNTWDAGPFGRVTPESQSPIQLQMGTDGRYRWQVTGCYVPLYTRNDVTRSFSSYSSAVGTSWYYWVVRWRCARSLADGPLLTVWNAVGAGSLSVEYSLTGTPIGLYDTPIDNLYPKLGLYQFSLPAADSTMNTKGLYVFRDESGTPTINETALLALLRSI